MEVKFVHGRKAVMTIYESSDDGDKSGEESGWVEKEQIVLSDYKTKEEMHALMVQKGFQLKSPEEVEVIQKKHKIEADAARIARAMAEEEREERRIRREEMNEQREEKMRRLDARAEVEGGGGGSMSGLNRVDGRVIADDDDDEESSSDDDSGDDDSNDDKRSDDSEDGDSSSDDGDGIPLPPPPSSSDFWTEKTGAKEEL